MFRNKSDVDARDARAMERDLGAMPGYDMANPRRAPQSRQPMDTPEGVISYEDAGRLRGWSEDKIIRFIDRLMKEIPLQSDMEHAENPTGMAEYVAELMRQVSETDVVTEAMSGPELSGGKDVARAADYETLANKIGAHHPGNLKQRAAEMIMPAVDEFRGIGPIGNPDPNQQVDIMGSDPAFEIPPESTPHYLGREMREGIGAVGEGIGTVGGKIAEGAGAVKGAMAPITDKIGQVASPAVDKSAELLEQLKQKMSPAVDKTAELKRSLLEQLGLRQRHSTPYADPGYMPR